ncbi:MAG: alpha/beta hydrolase, partial [Verrucomicrobiaceae bacterium]|nr:alpha/beta hydrolase [Verrucomicrobiaceae bacterium]
IYPQTYLLTRNLIPESTIAYEQAPFLSTIRPLFFIIGQTEAEWAGFHYRFDYSDTAFSSGADTFYQLEAQRTAFEVQPVLSPAAPADARRSVLMHVYSHDYLSNTASIIQTGMITFTRHNVTCSPNIAKHCRISGNKIVIEPLIDFIPPDLHSSSAVTYIRPYLYTQLIPIDLELVPDHDRDGDIDADDKGKVSAAQPWRWWVNDDDDDGELAFNDTPGQVADADLRGHAVDGLCDLPDFFPLHLQIKPLLDVFPAATHEYRLRHPPGALSFVETSMDANSTAQFLTDGPVAESLKNAATRRMRKETPNTLSTAFLTDIQQNPGKGIVLIEGYGNTEQPMYVQVLKQGVEVATLPFHVKIAGIEQMYRWINLRGVADLDPAENGAPIGSVSRATAVSQPTNRPDSLTNGKHFVMVHGYNVSEDSARGWGAEVFKRMYQLGMKSKFTIVSWQGNTSQALGITPDYWENVTNAFITAPHLKAAVEALSGTKIIAAHSLGNMVVSSAIQDHGMTVEKYFMLDAAVPLEAYDTSHESRDLMRNPTWQDYNTTALHPYWASDWHKQFLSTADMRKTLTWRGRFGDIPNAINYYSSGEEVLENGDGTWPGLLGLPTQAWVAQEMGKGRADSAMALVSPGVFEDLQGGWGLNHNLFVQEGGSSRQRTPAELAQVVLSSTPAEPFFLRFQIADLHDPSLGSATASQYWVRAKTLAEGIPSLSFPAGSNPIGDFDDRNIDLMTLKDN